MNEWNDLLKGMDKKTLENNMDKATAFSKTPQGKALIDKLKGASPTDADALIKLIKENPDLIQSVESFFKK